MSKAKNKVAVEKKSAPPIIHQAKFWEAAEAYLNSKFKFVLGAILVAGIIIRIIYFVQLNNSPCINYHLYEESDMNFFDRWAKHLAQDDWLQHTTYNNYTAPHKLIAESFIKKYPEKIAELRKQIPNGAEADLKELGMALFEKWGGEKVYFQEPFYVYCIATIYKLLGTDVRWVFLLQMFLGIGTLALIFLISRHFFGNIAALISGVFALLCGPLLFYDLILIRECMIVFTGLLLVYFISFTLENKTKTNLFVCGVLIGISILVKSIFAIFAVVFLILIFLELRKEKKRISVKFLPIFIGLFIGLSPVIIRNTIVGISPFSIATNGTYTFITSNFFGYDPKQGFMVSPSNADLYNKTNGVFLPSVIETFKTFPSVSEYLSLLWEKFKVLFLWVEIPNNKSFYYYRLNANVLNFTFINFSIIASMAIPGIAISLTRKQRPWSLYILIITHVAILIGFYVLSRYRIPLTAALIPFAGLFVTELIRKIELKSLHFIPVIVSGLALFFIIDRPAPNSMFPLRSSDYISPYYFYYKPKIDTALAHGKYDEAYQQMNTFFKLKPKELDDLNSNSVRSNANTISLANNYASIYKEYSEVAGANNKKEDSVSFVNRALELAAFAEKFTPATDVFSLYRKAQKTTDPQAKVNLINTIVANLKQSLTSNSKDLNSYGLMADIMLNDLHDSAQFELYMQKALQDFPDNPQLQFTLGRYYLYSLKNLEKGKQLIEASIKVWTDNAQAYSALAYYYAGYKRINEAIPYWQKAIALNPADSSAARNLRRFKVRQ